MVNDAAIMTKLGRLSAISAGFPLRGASHALNSGDNAFIQLRNVSRGSGIDWPKVDRVTLPSTKHVDYLQPGDIILAARGTLNFAYHIPDLDFPAVCAPQFFVVRVNDKEKLLPKFLTWQLNAPPSQHYFTTVAVGSAMKSIRRTAVENLEIAIPALAHQRAIVKLWEAAIAEEQVLKHLITNRKNLLNGLAQGLFKKEIRHER